MHLQDYISYQIRDNISNNINEFLHGISTDLLPIDYLASNTLEDPMLGKVIFEIKINVLVWKDKKKTNEL